MAEAARRTRGRIFEIERRGETILVVPLTDLRECEYQRIEAGAEEVLKLLDGPGVLRQALEEGPYERRADGVLQPFRP